jgi:hypothetical protein
MQGLACAAPHASEAGGGEGGAAARGAAAASDMGGYVSVRDPREPPDTAFMGNKSPPRLPSFDERVGGRVFGGLLNEGTGGWRSAHVIKGCPGGLGWVDTAILCNAAPAATAAVGVLTGHGHDHPAAWQPAL